MSYGSEHLNHEVEASQRQHLLVEAKQELSELVGKTHELIAHNAASTAHAVKELSADRMPNRQGDILYYGIGNLVVPLGEDIHMQVEGIYLDEHRPGRTMSRIEDRPVRSFTVTAETRFSVPSGGITELQTSDTSSYDKHGFAASSLVGRRYADFKRKEEKADLTKSYGLDAYSTPAELKEDYSTVYINQLLSSIVLAEIVERTAAFANIQLSPEATSAPVTDILEVWTRIGQIGREPFELKRAIQQLPIHTDTLT